MENKKMANKILVVLTNTSRYPNKQEATGLWLAEATEFVAQVQEAGLAVDYVSPKGGYVPIDPRSLKEAYLDEETLNIYQSDDFRKRALGQSLAPHEVSANNYVAIYFTGGYGVLWNFYDNQELHQIAENIYENGGFVTSVCHGLAGLLNLKDSQGQFLIAGRKITGFTQGEEILSGKHKLVPFGTEREAKKRGADFQKKRPFASYAVQDDRLITGQNPQSGRAVADLLIKTLKKI